VRSGTIVSPDTATAGWTRVRVEEDGKGHFVMIFRMPAGATDRELGAFLSALDTAAATPHPAVALGGPEVGDFAYGGAERWPAGSQILRVESRGKQDHQLRIAKLRDGASVRDWLNAEEPDQLATAVADVARMGPGTVTTPISTETMPTWDHRKPALPPIRGSYVTKGSLRSDRA
jgi:hypothetical protein